MRVVKVPPVDFKIAIEFNKEEADALLAVCNRVGGDIRKSARRHFDALGEILKEAGADPENVLWDYSNCRIDGIYFETPEE